MAAAAAAVGAVAVFEVSTAAVAAAVVALAEEIVAAETMMNSACATDHPALRYCLPPLQLGALPPQQGTQ